MRHLLSLAMALALLAAVAVVATAGPAPADGGQLGLSWDGRHWSTALDGALFDRPRSIRTWVPGDTETESFYVRNQASDLGELEIEYRWPRAAPLVYTRDFELSMRVGRGAWQPMPGATGWRSVGTAPLASAAQTRVRVRAVFHWSSPNPSQVRKVPLKLRVTLTEAAGAPLSHPSGGPGGPGAPGHPAGPGSGAVPAGPGPAATGPLAPTGTPAYVDWLVGLAALCLGGGAALVVGSRRRKEQGDEQGVR